ncbi:hydantoinase B/oxoprolinase family protein [Paraburkholderia sp.]|uniref:hydantoinase B/oxoprolinase family protein n=1 Tax=Paraburkholderia sp. TaxID=1926495 RepID=UPI0039E5344D
MKLDSVTLEILNNKVAAITEEMCLTLQRTGRTLYVKETADFACALVGLDGRFFAYPRSIGISGFVGLECLPAIQAVGPLEPGDIILTNDPYRSEGLATHLPDFHMIKPYFHEGKIVAYGWCFVHCSDIGGRVPSSISPTNAEIFQEGIRIPPVKFMRAGKTNDDICTLLDANSRTPDANMGDIRAMIGTLAAGERRIAQVIKQHGVDALLDGQRDLVAYADIKARSVISTIPNGTYRFVDYLDDDAVSSLPVRLALAVTVDNGTVNLDFTGTDPQVAAAMNIPSRGRPHSWLTLRVVALIHTLDKTVPVNAGLLGPVSVTAPPGTIVNPEEPAATGVRHAAATRVNDVLNGAFGLALPSVMPAAASGLIVPVVLAEPDDAGGHNVQVLEPLIGGAGAWEGHDGIDGRDCGIANLANNPVETVEAEIAVEIIRYALRPDSGGPGKWRGGCGVELTFRVLVEGSYVLARGLERLVFRPWGRCGGGPGQPGSLVVNEGKADERRLGKIDVIELSRGDIVSFHMPGAGGWGDPYERDAAAVLADVQNGLVTIEGAQRDYGVVIRDDAVDQISTASLRKTERVPSPDIAFGPEREAWDSVFCAAQMDRFNAMLLKQPLARRQKYRREAVNGILSMLPKGFPKSPANEESIRLARSAFSELSKTI